MRLLGFQRNGWNIEVVVHNNKKWNIEVVVHNDKAACGFWGFQRNGWNIEVVVHNDKRGGTLKSLCKEHLKSLWLLTCVKKVFLKFIVFSSHKYN